VPFNPGDIVTVDFPGVTGIKRRPTVVLSSAAYHATRPDAIVGLITLERADLAQLTTNFKIGQRQVYGLLLFFGSFIVTLPPSANLIYIGHLSERDWTSVRMSVKVALAELEDSPDSKASS
jgi:mRNA interferase MazF